VTSRVRKPKLVGGEDTILKIRHLAHIQYKEEAAGALLAGERVFLISAPAYSSCKAREGWKLGLLSRI